MIPPSITCIMPVYQCPSLNTQLRPESSSQRKRNPGPVHSQLNIDRRHKGLPLHYSSTRACPYGKMQRENAVRQSFDECISLLTFYKGRSGLR